MANVTLSIDENTLTKARMYAARNGTTLNSMIREFLEELIDERGRKQTAQDRINQILSKLKMTRKGTTWTREELNER